ncbi:MAG TPA: hypothetical protein VEL31_22425 [Ktedonobacteraceae bacterium]|nr:hypothetical protein [Ktedonobacteraceae bacterium]
MLRDILRDTPAYQQLLEEGREEERQKRAQSLSQKLLNIVQTRFPELKTMTKNQISLIKKPETLEDLMINIALSSNAEEAKDALKAWKETEASDEEEI